MRIDFVIVAEELTGSLPESRFRRAGLQFGSTGIAGIEVGLQGRLLDTAELLRQEALELLAADVAG